MCNSAIQEEATRCARSLRFIITIIIITGKRTQKRSVLYNEPHTSTTSLPAWRTSIIWPAILSLCSLNRQLSQTEDQNFKTRSRRQQGKEASGNNFLIIIISASSSTTSLFDRRVKVIVKWHDDEKCN